MFTFFSHYRPLQLKIEKEFGGKAVLRMAKAKAGPVVTDNGNLLLDWTFDLTELKKKFNIDLDKDLWEAVNTKIICMAGVVDTGLFVNMAKVAYFGDGNGQVTAISIQKKF